MATYSKAKLSGSTDGKGIKVTQTAIASGDTIHTAVSGTSNFDEVWIWAVNTTSTAVKLTLGWGGTTDPDSLIEYTVAGEDGLKCIIPGLVLQNGGVIKASAGTANALVIYGYVNAITA